MCVEYYEEDGITYQKYISSGAVKIRRYVSNKVIPDELRPIYNEWRYMRKRCQVQNAPYSRYYYNKGIKVCEEWDSLDTGFKKFCEWAYENGYEIGLSIDRINSNQGYNPNNCRWITPQENSKLGSSKPHIPKWEYRAYNESECLLLIFYKTKDFNTYTGIDERRVSDGCNKANYYYKGWKFDRRPINLEYYGSQETIPNGSTLDDELPMEVRVIYLPTEVDKDIVHSA